MTIFFWKLSHFFHNIFYECIDVWCSLISKHIHKATHFIFLFIWRREITMAPNFKIKSTWIFVSYVCWREVSYICGTTFTFDTGNSYWITLKLFARSNVIRNWSVSAAYGTVYLRFCPNRTLSYLIHHLPEDLFTCAQNICTSFLITQIPSAYH